MFKSCPFVNFMNVDKASLRFFFSGLLFPPKGTCSLLGLQQRNCFRLVLSPDLFPQAEKFSSYRGPLVSCANENKLLAQGPASAGC